MAVSVDRIEIKIGRKTLVLSPDELKELREVLDEAFPKDKTTFVPSAPIIIERDRWPWSPYQHWRPYWCESTTVDGRSDNGVSVKTSGTLRIECKSEV